MVLTKASRECILEALEDGLSCCFTTMEMASRCGYGEKAIRRAFKALERQGILKRVTIGGLTFWCQRIPDCAVLSIGGFGCRITQEGIRSVVCRMLEGVKGNAYMLRLSKLMDALGMERRGARGVYSGLLIAVLEKLLDGVQHEMYMRGDRRFGILILDVEGARRRICLGRPLAKTERICRPLRRAG
jgi:hypothetical protein